MRINCGLIPPNINEEYSFWIIERTEILISHIAGFTTDEIGSSAVLHLFDKFTGIPAASVILLAAFILSENRKNVKCLVWIIYHACYV